jgi:niacin transporter
MTYQPRHRLSTTTITGTALLLALGILLPMLFHMFPLGGRIFLPMHIPTFIAGLVLGPIAGLIVGAGSPVLSSILVGRPPVFYMVPMVFELATYGFVAGLLRPWFCTFLRKRWGRGAEDETPESRARAATLSVWFALVPAMVVGRVVWVLVVVWFAPVIGIQARTVVAAFAAIGAGWVGMAIQLALVPAIVRAIERVRKA